MVEGLRKYYADEFELLRILAEGDASFGREYIELHPTTLNHLSGYGVIDPASLTIAIPVFSEWLRTHSL